MESKLLGHMRVSKVGSPEVLVCKVHEDVVDLRPALETFQLRLSEEVPCRTAHLIHEDGSRRKLLVDSPTPPTALVEPQWCHARLVFDMPARVPGTKFKKVPVALRSINVQTMIKRGVPLGVAEGFRDSWEQSSHAKPALHKHNLILHYLECERQDPHGPDTQVARIDLHEFLACPGGDTKRVGKELKNYTLSPSHTFLLRKHQKYPSCGRLCTRWVRALTGRPEDIGVLLWEDHSKRQFHPGQKYAAANVKDYYLPGIVNFAVDIVKNCPDCIVWVPYRVISAAPR